MTDGWSPRFGPANRLLAVAGLCTALLLGGCAAGPVGTSDGASPPTAARASLPQLGVNTVLDTVPPTRRRAEFARLAAMGATWVRTGARWDALEPDGPTVDPVALRHLDDVVADARAAGLHVLLIADWAPGWAGGSGHTASRPEAYGRYLGDLAAHLRGRGPRGSSPAYELMNEPDNAYDGPPWADPTEYAHAACAAFRAIKQGDPASVVAAGSLDVTDWKPWLGTAFRAGLGGCFDVLSAHPYPGLSVLDDIREFAAEQGVPNVSIWATEFGASTCTSVVSSCVSEGEQADWIVRTLSEAGRTRPWVPVAIIYTDQDDPRHAGKPAERAYGLYDPTMREKPAVAAVRALYGAK